MKRRDLFKGCAALLLAMNMPLSVTHTRRDVGGHIRTASIVIEGRYGEKGWIVNDPAFAQKHELTTERWTVLPDGRYARAVPL